MAPAPPSSTSSAERFALFAHRYCGLRLEAFQRLIVTEACSGRRELLVLLPRGNGKTTLFAALSLFELLTTPDAAVYCAAASRDQARLLFETARKMSTGHPEIDRLVTARHAELRPRRVPARPRLGRPEGARALADAGPRR